MPTERRVAQCVLTLSSCPALPRDRMLTTAIFPISISHVRLEAELETVMAERAELQSRINIVLAAIMPAASMRMSPALEAASRTVVSPPHIDDV